MPGATNYNYPGALYSGHSTFLLEKELNQSNLCPVALIYPESEAFASGPRLLFSSPDSCSFGVHAYTHD